MKLLHFITQAFIRLREKSRNSKLQKRAKYLENLSCESINVMEFDGRLHISFNGAPVIRIDELKGKVPEILAQSREDFLAWKNKFNT